MKKILILSLVLRCAALLADVVSVDLSALQPGPVTVKSSASALAVHWKDNSSRNWTAEFSINSAKPLITSVIGDRVEISFDGMRTGIFEGSIGYIFYPGSRLIEQQPAMITQEPDTAYFYDAGLRMAEPADQRPGGNMESHISYFETQGDFQTITFRRYGSVSTARDREISGASHTSKIIVKPCAGKPHARFERGGLETGWCKPVPR